MLRCIRCGACMNHCPVYLATGGHAYGWVYPGPMGAVLTPSFIGIEQGRHLPSASTFCGRCEQVCPMRIPLPRMMRYWREQHFAGPVEPAGAALRHAPLGFRRDAGRGSTARRRAWSSALLGLLGRRTGRFRRLPLAGGWTVSRDLPAPAGPDLSGQMARRARFPADERRARAAMLGRLRRALGRSDGDGPARGRRAPRQAAARHHPGARRPRPSPAGSRCSSARPKPSRPASGAWTTMRRSPPPWWTICARRICRCAW